MECSLAAAVTLLAVLKSGAGYVAVDPANPQSRVDWQIAHVQVPVLITQEHLVSRLDMFPGRVLCLGR